MDANRRTQIRLNTIHLLLTEKPDKFNALDISRLYNKIMRESENWHEFSDYLSLLDMMKIVKLVGHNNDGMCIYSLNV